jgi:CRP-like cAMP-binding protein
MVFYKPDISSFYKKLFMKKVLVIEDNEDIRENTAEILELSHYQVITASNGKEGVEKALANKPDIILCDIMMPELDGYGVLHMVQKNPELQKTPFIFLTAKAENTEVRKGMSLGADDYIPKPFDPSDLLTAIESRLKKADIFNLNLSGLHGMNELIELVKGEKALQEFVDGRHLDKYKKKEKIYSEGNRPTRLYFVESGKVKVFKVNDDGKEFILKIVNPGEFFGYIALLENSVYHEYAEAIEPSEVAAIPKNEFEDLMNSNPEVTRKFITLLANDVSERETQLINIAYSSLRRKVADALISVHRRFCADTNAFIGISRENLAAIAGTATESLIRTLTDFREEKLIDIKEGKINILQLDRLTNMVN